MAPKPKKTWREKLADSKNLPQTLVIPAPLDVDAVMKRVRKGKLTTIAEIRRVIARKYGTDTACPFTTGIFAWIAAHAAEEAETAGKRRITPYWRTLKTGGELNPKYPGGIKGQRTRLEAEGHEVVRKGKKHLVRDYEKRLATL